MKKTAVITLLLFCLKINAAQLDLFPQQDNTIYETISFPLSNGASQYLFTGRTGNNNDNALRRAVLKFDLNQIPDRSTINSVELVLTVSRQVNNSNVSLHLTESDWGKALPMLAPQEVREHQLN